MSRAINQNLFLASISSFEKVLERLNSGQVQCYKTPQVTVFFNYFIKYFWKNRRKNDDLWFFLGIQSNHFSIISVKKKLLRAIPWIYEIYNIDYIIKNFDKNNTPWNRLWSNCCFCKKYLNNLYKWQRAINKDFDRLYNSKRSSIKHSFSDINDELQRNIEIALFLRFYVQSALRFSMV